jgi:hypothetical protein
LFALLLCATSASARDLPDPKLTPGVTVEIDLEELCAKKWGKDHRFVTQAMKREVFARYGLSGNNDRSCKSPRHFEIDHLISRELGGADAIENLWPQCYGGEPWNAVKKDRLENRLHREVCNGSLSLEQAQADIAADWREVWKRYFGKDE